MKKSKAVKVNLSSSFLSRACCIKCGSRPKYYFYSRNPIMWYDPYKNRELFDFVKKYMNRMSPEDYVLNDFVSANKIGYYNHPVPYKGYKPKLHRTRGTNPVFDLVEHLTCECGASVWSFAEKSISNKPEIFQRKSRYKHKNKFTF